MTSKITELDTVRKTTLADEVSTAIRAVGFSKASKHIKEHFELDSKKLIQTFSLPHEAYEKIIETCDLLEKHTEFCLPAVNLIKNLEKSITDYHSELRQKPINKDIFLSLFPDKLISSIFDSLEKDYTDAVLLYSDGRIYCDHAKKRNLCKEVLSNILAGPKSIKRLCEYLSDNFESAQFSENSFCKLTSYLIPGKGEIRLKQYQDVQTIQFFGALHNPTIDKNYCIEFNDGWMLSSPNNEQIEKYKYLFEAEQGAKLHYQQENKEIIRLEKKAREIGANSIELVIYLETLETRLKSLEKQLV